MFSSIGKTPESEIEARERPARSTSAAWAQALKHQKWQGVCRRDDSFLRLILLQRDRPLRFLSTIAIRMSPNAKSRTR